MTTITEQTTVSETVRSVPATARVFQQCGIDFCCGGAKTIAQASKDWGVALEALLEKLRNADREPDNTRVRNWNVETVSALVDHIVAKHHAYLRSELPRLAVMLDKVIAKHAERHGESLHPLDIVYREMKRELEEHMWKEENVLFPLIKQMEQATIRREALPLIPISKPIQTMEMEHESTGNALRRIRRLSANYQAPADACNTYRALLDGLKTMEEDLHEHIHLENNILFPRAVEMQRQ